MKIEFEKVNEDVKVNPMGTLFCKRVMDRFRKEMVNKIKPCCCYENAVIAAEWLIERGFDIEIVEGQYKPNEYGEKLARREINSYVSEHPTLGAMEYDGHRFCRKGDKYFDPTTEILLGVEGLKLYDYRALRIYDIDDIIDFAEEITLKDYGVLHFTDSITGLTYVYKGKDDVPLFWGCIDDNGVVVKPDYNPFKRRAEILAA